MTLLTMPDVMEDKGRMKSSCTLKETVVTESNLSPVFPVALKAMPASAFSVEPSVLTV